jgi:putative aldouronate transport system permease protein
LKKKRGALYYLKRDFWLYLCVLPVIVYYVVFKYLPMAGIVMAFQDYNIFKGVLGSKFVGLENFVKIWKSQQFWNSVRNTLVLNLATLAASFPLTIALALMLNELRAVKFKRVSQSLLYLPHFISWVVVAGIAQNMFNMSNGTVNKVLESIGGGPVPFLSNNGWWIFTYILCNIWKEIGWGTIIYLAALTGVDESLYEAAYLDGATRIQRIRYITLPMIKSVAVTMLILNVSSMMSIGLDAPLLLGNTKVMAISEVISTYVYRLGIEKAQYDLATAIGLFQSLVNIIILVIVDRIAKCMGEEGIL